MSKSLSVASVIEKNNISSDTPFLIMLNIDVVNPATGSIVTTMNVVRNTEAVTFQGHTYAAASFDIELKEESGSQQSISLNIKDYTNAVQHYMQSYGGGVGFSVSIMIVNAGALSQPPEVIEYFQIIAAESSGYAVSFTLGAENALSHTFPRRRQARDFCQWRYKEGDCGYSGYMPSCDLSLKGANGCKVHDNVIHFGAFPGINTRDINYG